MVGTFPKIGDVIGSRYMIESVIGKGGFSCVFKGTQLSLDRPVAIKVMVSSEHVENTDQKEMEGRFRREAMLVAKLQNPHTITLYDFGLSSAGFLYMVFEFVKGKDLSDIVEKEGPQTEQRTAQVLTATLSSLYEAHSYGVLHRDIKPGNIMLYDYLDFHDLVKLLDFGIAKPVAEDFDAFQQLTATGTMIGTPRYMAPEQIRGATPAPSADIYSLGLVAYEMLTGTKAIPGENHMSIITRQIDPASVQLPGELPGIDEGLRKIVNRMIEKDLVKRYSEVREVLADLSKLEHLNVIKTSPSWDFPQFESDKEQAFAFPIFSPNKPDADQLRETNMMAQTGEVRLKRTYLALFAVIIVVLFVTCLALLFFILSRTTKASASHPVHEVEKIEPF